MKKILFTLLIVLGGLTASFAQTQISGYLESDPTDGINAAAAAAANYFAAVQACRTLIHDSKTDWYLPSTEEIVLFANGSSLTGAAPGCIGNNCDWNINWCWTRTADIGHWGVSSGGGIGLFRHSLGGGANTFSHADGNSGAHYVRCVR